jgi:DNA-binding GntR family transcriptional regulator
MADEQRAGSAAERVAQTLRARVLDGQLPPGTRLGQEQIARELSVSRIPVRDALGQLAHERLITVVPNSGAMVTRLEESELVETYRIREALEPLALAESATRVTDLQLAAVDREVARMGSLGGGDGGDGDGDGRAWLEHDRRFHAACTAAAGMPRLMELIESLRNLTQAYRVALRRLLTPADLEEIRDEHRMIASALHVRDPDVAEAVMRTHLRRTRGRIAEHPELFRSTTARRRANKSGADSR